MTPQIEVVDVFMAASGDGTGVGDAVISIGGDILPSRIKFDIRLGDRATGERRAIFTFHLDPKDQCLLPLLSMRGWEENLVEDLILAQEEAEEQEADEELYVDVDEGDEEDERPEDFRFPGYWKPSKKILSRIAAN